MRVWLVRLVLLGVIAAAGIWAWHWLFPSPEQAIRNELKQVAAAASVAPNEGQLARLANTQKLVGFFSPDVQINVDLPGRASQSFSGRDELQQAALGARSFLGSLKVRFLDVSVIVAPDRQSAEAHLTATATLPGEKLPEVQELRIHFRKVDRAWPIDRVDTVKTLR
jgi:hypothetical protein